ncbi:MAG: formylmethanofuran dehydrogenase [Chloroflexi bacterium]|nr:MAG: formylmethanofuran dehydrogenase [Chloroflexota bacterium]
MSILQSLLEESAAHHNHLCPRQVLGVRMGLLAGNLLGMKLPQTKKLMYTFVESDGCGMGGISTATGCKERRRTLRVLDFGKLAATFVELANGRSLRIYPHPQAREKAIAALPNVRGRWQRQLQAYQFLSDEDLFVVQPVRLTVSMKKIISRPKLRVNCNSCGEEIGNEREIIQNGYTLCRSCAGESYYQIELDPAFTETHESILVPKTNGSMNHVYSNHHHYQQV